MSESSPYEHIDDLKDELEQKYRWLLEDITDLEERVESIETLEDRITELEAENERLKAELQSTSSKAEAALSQVSQSDESKEGIARRITRNTLVLRCANDKAATDRPVTTSEVKQKAEGRVEDLAWMTIKRAWEELQDNWPEVFHETQKNGTQALSTSPKKVTPALAAAVEDDMELEGENLANGFVGDNTEGR